METRTESRRRFLGRLATVVGGLAAIPLLGTSAQAGRTTWRRRFGYGGYGYGGYGGYGYGYPRYRLTTRRRRYYGGYGYGGYGYGGYGYGGYGGYYTPAPVAPAPVVVPATPYYTPVVPSGVQFQSYQSIQAYPMMKNSLKPWPDPLGLLEV